MSKDSSNIIENLSERIDVLSDRLDRLENIPKVLNSGFGESGFYVAQLRNDNITVVEWDDRYGTGLIIGSDESWEASDFKDVVGPIGLDNLLSRRQGD
jgi:hypothetical protein